MEEGAVICRDCGADVTDVAAGHPCPMWNGSARQCWIELVDVVTIDWDIDGDKLLHYLWEERRPRPRMA